MKLAPLLAIALLACDSAPLCVPGASAPCTCTNGAVGAQVCNAEGAAFLPCQCEGTADDVVAADAVADAGTDVGAVLEDASVPPPALSVNPSWVTFGEVPVGETEARPLTLSNGGAGPLVVTHLGFTGSGQFHLSLGGLETGPTGSVVLPEPLTIAPGEFVSGEVVFAPLKPGPANATLVVFSNDPGFVGGFVVSIQAYLSGPCIEVKPGALDFGTVAVGGEASLLLNLRSCGVLPLLVGGVSLDPWTSPAFSLDLSGAPGFDPPPTGAKPVVIAHHTWVPLVVRYAPKEGAAKGADGTMVPDKGLLRIDSSDGGGATLVPLSGFSAPVGSALAKASVDEGTSVIPQTVLHLRGEESTVDGGPVARYEWSVAQPPGSVSLFVPGPDVPNPTFEANVAGTYTFSLTVWNGLDEPSPPAMLQVFVIPDTAIHVELLWDTPNDPDQSDEGPEAGSDVDLHFTHQYASGPDLDGDGKPDGWFDQPFDCYWFNPHPNWGSFDPAVDDDPSLDRDDTDSAGPENLSLRFPESGHIYRIGVHYWHDHKYGPTYATLRVFLFGELVWERTGVKLLNHDMWDAATITWPSGKVESVIGKGGGDKITPNYENPFFFQP
ncbi:MAG: hypothetical protein AMXMBFR64_13150 [Myxococcales bacterium]